VLVVSLQNELNMIYTFTAEKEALWVVKACGIL
jgi:hypothetical protein